MYTQYYVCYAEDMCATKKKLTYWLGVHILIFIDDYKIKEQQKKSLLT